MSKSERNAGRGEPNWLDSARRAARKDPRQLNFIDRLFDQGDQAQSDQDQEHEGKKRTQSDAASSAPDQQETKPA